MAIARRTNLQSGNSGTTTAASATVTKPTDAAAGDVLVVAFSALNNTLAAPGPTISQASFTALSSNTWATYGSLTILWRAIQAGDPASWSFTISVTAVYCFSAIAYSGVDTTTPFSASGYVATPGSTLTDVSASITPGSVNDWIVSAFTDRITTSTSKTTGWAASAPGVEQVETNNNSKASSPWMSFEYNDDGAVVGSVASTSRTSVRTGPTAANANWQAFIGSLSPASGAAATARPKQQIVDQAVQRSMTRCQKLTRRRSGLFVPAEWKERLVIA